MIKINNQQRKVKVDITALKQDARRILEIIDYPDFDLGIVLVNPQKIQHYNRTYRNKDKPTDILSFSYHPDLKPGERIKATSEDDKNLGDLIICPEYVVKEAATYNMTFAERMRILLVHGICHLLGYDHEHDEDWHIMRTQEEFILKKLCKG